MSLDGGKKGRGRLKGQGDEDGKGEKLNSRLTRNISYIAQTKCLAASWQLTNGQLAVGVLSQVLDEGARHVPTTQNERSLVARSCRCGVPCRRTLTQRRHLGPKAKRPCSRRRGVPDRDLLSTEADMVGNKAPSAVTVGDIAYSAMYELTLLRMEANMLPSCKAL